MDDDDFTITYIIGTITNVPAGHQLLIQAKNNTWIIDINGEDTNTAEGGLDELQHYQTQCGNSKVKIIFFISTIYQRKYI